MEYIRKKFEKNSKEMCRKLMRKIWGVKHWKIWLRLVEVVTKKSQPPSNWLYLVRELLLICKMTTERKRRYTSAGVAKNALSQAQLFFSNFLEITRRSHTCLAASCEPRPQVLLGASHTLRVKTLHSLCLYKDSALFEVRVEIASYSSQPTKQSLRQNFSK